MVRVTIKDVAAEAGLSLGAVSQALNPNPSSTIKVSDATVERVRETAQKLGFLPHAGARSVRSNRFHNIGFFFARKGRYTRPSEGYLRGVSDAAQENGYRITLVGFESAPGKVQAAVSSLFQEKNLDALIVASYHQFSTQIHDALVDMGFPVIYANDYHLLNSIWVDDHAGGRMMTEHLIQRGYRSIVFALRGHLKAQKLEEMHYSARARLEGYAEAMKKAGLRPDIRMVHMPEALEVNQPIPSDWLLGQALPDAIFAYDDDLANSVARLLMRQGIRIPEEMGLAGYNGGYSALSAWRPLTTMQIPSYEMGYAALELAIKLIEKDDVTSLKSIRFVPELIAGETT